jgi:hypothetical protein
MVISICQHCPSLYCFMTRHDVLFATFNLLPFPFHIDPADDDTWVYVLLLYESLRDDAKTVALITRIHQPCQADNCSRLGAYNEVDCLTINSQVYSQLLQHGFRVRFVGEDSSLNERWRITHFIDYCFNPQGTGIFFVLAIVFLSTNYLSQSCGDDDGMDLQLQRQQKQPLLP